MRSDREIRGPRFYSCYAWLFFSKFKCFKFKLQTWYFLSNFWLNLKLLVGFFNIKTHLTDTGDYVQKWTRIFSTRRWDIFVARTLRKKEKKIFASNFGQIRLWTSFESSPVSVNQKFYDLNNLFTNDPLSKRCDEWPKLAQNCIEPFHTLIIRSTQKTRFLVFRRSDSKCWTKVS